MRFGHTAAALAILSLGSARVASGQATVSFDVPLNLTQVHVDIERVRVVCAVMGEAVVPPTTTGGTFGSSSWTPASETTPPPYAARQDLWVLGGQVVATVRVVVTIPAEYLVNPVGKKGMYVCMILGYSRTGQKWGMFSEQSTEVAFKLKVTPEGINGEFVW